MRARWITSLSLNHFLRGTILGEENSLHFCVCVRVAQLGGKGGLKRSARFKGCAKN
jgi:hypothetical protein